MLNSTFGVVTVLTCVISWYLGEPARAAANELSVEEAIRLVESATSAIHSFDIEIGFVQTFLSKSEVTAWKKVNDHSKPYPEIRAQPLRPGEKGQTRQYLYRQVFSKGKRRIEYLNSTEAKPFSVSLS